MTDNTTNSKSPITNGQVHTNDAFDDPSGESIKTPNSPTNCILRQISQTSTGSKFSLLNMLSWPLNFRTSIQSGDMVRKHFYELFIEPISEQHRRHFRKYFGSDISTKTFNINEFGRLFQITPMLSKRLLMIFDLKQACANDTIPGSDIIRIARLLWLSPISVKALILFKMFGGHDDDRISIDEIRSFYKHYLAEFRCFPDDKRSNEIVDIFLKGFFPIDNDVQRQELNFDQFYRILQQNPDVFKSLYLISIPDQDDNEDEETSHWQRWCMYIKMNAPRIVFLVVYFLSTLALIIYVIFHRIVEMKNQNGWQIVARVGGELVNFNYAVVISLMLKQTMVIIRRNICLRLFIPVDDHIDAHRLVGTMFVISAMVHTFGHVLHFATHTNEHSMMKSLFTTAAGQGWIAHSASITGDILVVLLIIMFIGSLQYIRQRVYKLFCYTHYLFWPMFLLLILHAHEFWKWAIGPMSLLLLEKIYLLKRHLPKYGRTRLISATIEDAHVLSLLIDRPGNFTFHTGEYINICFPNIVRNEWHPFTISSSPEQKDFLRIHMMKKKNWTRKVYEHFRVYQQHLNDDGRLTEIITDSNSKTSDTNSLPEIKFTAEQKDALVCIEGPFSSCTSYIFDCEHVVMIGAGIGITPYISALESLIYQFRKQRCICYHCGHIDYNDAMIKRRKLKKIDFIWVNHDVGNFSWFLKILDAFEAEQEGYLSAAPHQPEHQQQEHRSRYLDIHLYFTSLRSNDQAMLDNAAYDLVANMYAVMRHQDMHTRLRTPTRVGRPPWKLLFAKFKAENRSTNVFFTGNAGMGNEIKRHCDEHEFPFRHEPYF